MVVVPVRSRGLSKPPPGRSRNWESFPQQGWFLFCFPLQTCLKRVPSERLTQRKNTQTAWVPFGFPEQKTATTTPRMPIIFVTILVPNVPWCTARSGGHGGSPGCLRRTRTPSPAEDDPAGHAEGRGVCGGEDRREGPSLQSFQYPGSRNLWETLDTLDLSKFAIFLVAVRPGPFKVNQTDSGVKRTWFEHLEGIGAVLLRVACTILGALLPSGLP